MDTQEVQLNEEVLRRLFPDTTSLICKFNGNHIT
jgi:hypothetical protein